MEGKSDIRSYCNPWPPRHSQQAQEAKLGGEVYVEDRTGRLIDALIHSVRKGTIVEVVEVGLLAPVKGSPRKRKALMAERVDAIKAKGGVIREVETGHQSNKGQCAKMIVRGAEFIANSGRAGGKQDNAGRPGIKLTPHERAVAEGIWTSRRYGNDDARIIEIEKRVGKRLKRGWLWTHFGSPNGRQSTDKE